MRSFPRNPHIVAWSISLAVVVLLFGIGFLASIWQENSDTSEFEVTELSPSELEVLSLSIRESVKYAEGQTLVFRGTTVVKKDEYWASLGPDSSWKREPFWNDLNRAYRRSRFRTARIPDSICEGINVKLLDKDQFDGGLLEDDFPGTEFVVAVRPAVVEGEIAFVSLYLSPKGGCELMLKWDADTKKWAIMQFRQATVF